MGSVRQFALMFFILCNSVLVHYAHNWPHANPGYIGHKFKHIAHNGDSPPWNRGHLGNLRHGVPFQNKWEGGHHPGYPAHRGDFGGNLADMASPPDYGDWRTPEPGCFCLLYVEQTEVFRRTNLSPEYSCDSVGLQECSYYCNSLFNDQGLVGRSRQDACDVLGREVSISWFRRDMVCGRGGLRRDEPLTSNLCCRGGRATACQ